MQKNIKILTAALALLTVLTACQPTPEAEPVKQKDTDKLIEMAVGVESPSDSSEEENAPTLTAGPVSFAERFSERFNVDYTTTSSGAKVVGDVKIKYLSDNAFPMYRMYKALPEGEKVRELAGRLLGSEEVYVKTSFQSKADIKAEIDRISEMISRKDIRKERMEKFGETEEEVEQWLAEWQEELRSLQQKYNAMTGEEERPLFESWDGTYSTEPAENGKTSRSMTLVEREDAFGEVPYVQIRYNNIDSPSFNLNFYRNINEDFGYGYHISEIPEDWSVPCGNAKMTPQEAADAAIALFDGILDVQAVEIRWGDNGSDTSPGTGYAYTVCLTPAYHGAGTVYTDMRNADYQKNDSRVHFGWGHETIEVSISDKGIHRCSWSGHMEIGDELTEEVNLLDFDTIYALFTQQMNRKLAMADKGTEVKLIGVTLGLMRIREENSFETALLVPVWQFRGLYGNTDYYQEVLGQDYSPLCVLNAIDGSVIDNTLGY